MTLDKTSDRVSVKTEFRRKGGLLRPIAERQMDVQEILSTLRHTEDRTIDEGLASNLGHPDAVITAVVLAAKEMSRDPQEDIAVIDLIWAGAILDHLATLGFEVRRKQDDAA